MRRRNVHPAPIGALALSPQSPSFALLRQHHGLLPRGSRKKLRKRSRFQDAEGTVETLPASSTAWTPLVPESSLRLGSELTAGWQKTHSGREETKVKYEILNNVFRCFALRLDLQVGHKLSADPTFLNSWVAGIDFRLLKMDEGIEISSDGNSLIKAVHQSRLRLTRLLLEGGAYINESNDRGETPLMIACKTKHVDHQSVSKAKMVKYLLENNADPNIQDKSGKTALMHACLEKAGPEVVSLLLQSGADLSLQDHSSYSALVYAINSEDRETLKVLLSACKAKGKEVIIITTAKSPSGRHRTRQFLNMPPADMGGSHSSASCTTPSEIDIKTASLPRSHSSEAELMLSGFKDREPSGSSDDAQDPSSPGKKLPVAPNGPKLAQAPPWLKSPPLLMHQVRVASLQEELQDITPEEELSYKTNGLALSKRFITRHQSIDVKDTAHLLRALDQASSRKMSYDEINYQSFFPEGNQQCIEIPVDQDPDSNQTMFASTLGSIVQKRNSGANHYSSDSQLAAGVTPPTSEDGKALTGKKKVLSPSPLQLSGGKELFENMPPGVLSRRNHAVLERRGSGAFPLDHNITQTRPGFLPPLNVNSHPASSDVNVSKICSLFSCGQKVFVPTVPIFPKELKSKKMLLRRQSLQTEQIKQLVNF
ncbi:ankyrin repeat domain-containing protein 34B isoform X2 [Nycticebus coucang]|uniref:ankyrin repeat domain-containing protein 34B isoform X2 n=1 Tax=Nycticebus coucang TaxID=9470 RepID=UPI00234D6876|nr:ankyrin repeat domain-containing protein 34B isoform X2 [Nycticebus coucang]